MLATIHSAAVLGIDAYDVCVEVDVAQGLPHWTKARVKLVPHRRWSVAGALQSGATEQRSTGLLRVTDRPNAQVAATSLQLQAVLA